MNSKKGSQTIEFVIMAMLVLVIGFTGLTIFGDNIKAFFEGNATKTASLSSANAGGYTDELPPGFDPDKELDRLLDEINEIASGSQMNASSSLIDIANTLMDYFNYLKTIGEYDPSFDKYMDLLRSILGLKIGDQSIPNDVLEKLVEFTNQFDETNPDSLINALLGSIAGMPDNHPEKVLVAAIASLGANINVDISSVIDMIKNETISKANQAAQDAQNAIDNLINANKSFLEGLGADLSNATIDDIIALLNSQESSLSGTDLEFLMNFKSSLMDENNNLINALNLTNPDNLEGMTSEELLLAYLALAQNNTNNEINDGIEIYEETPSDEFAPPSDIKNLKDFLSKDEFDDSMPIEGCPDGYYFSTTTGTCRSSSVVPTSTTSSSGGGGSTKVTPYEYPTEMEYAVQY